MTSVNRQTSGSRGPQRHITVKKLKSLARPLLREYPAVPFPFCITAEVQEAILSTVGQRRPETGGMLFGPIDRMGVSLFEFDTKGSAAASGSAYKPDNVGGQKRRDFHLSTDSPLIWWGQLHSHPGQFNRPSGKSGRGEGDMGYVEEVFIQNESMQHFFMPILNFDSDGSVFISPYIITRDHPDRVQIATDVVICDESEFPESEFPVPFRLKDIEDKVKGLSKLTSRDAMSQREIKELRGAIQALSAEVTQLAQQTARGDKSLRQEIERRQEATQAEAKKLYKSAHQRIEELDQTTSAKQIEIFEKIDLITTAQKKSVENKIDAHSRIMKRWMIGLLALNSLFICIGSAALYANYTQAERKNLGSRVPFEAAASPRANAERIELGEATHFGPQ